VGVAVSCRLTFWESLDLASSRRERILDRHQHVLVTPIIIRLVADDDILVRRNRHPNVDAEDGTLVVLRIRRDDSNPTPGDVVSIFFEPLHLVFDCSANGL
jgi:hypothetical protein